MKIIVPSAGPAVDQRTVGYVISIAKRLKAQLVVVRVLTEKEKEADGERNLSLFVEIGKRENVPVNIILRHGDSAPAIIEIAQEKSVDLILLGVSHGEIVAEWLNAGAMALTDIPVLLIPKWVPAPQKSSPDECVRVGVK